LILLAVGIVMGFLYYLAYGWGVVTAAIPTIGLLSGVAILMNRFGMTLLSRMWISLFIPIVVTSLSIYSKTLYYDRADELDYFTFRFFILGSCSFPWTLFSFREKNYLFFTAALGFLILMLHDPLHEFFDVPYNNEKLKAAVYSFTNIVIFFSYCILAGSLAFLKLVSERNENRNLELIAELNHANEALVSKNAEIEAQSSELLAQSEILNTNQKQLLDAYEVIHVQKVKLQSQNQSLSSELVAKNKDLTDTNTELITHNNELRQFSYTISHNLRGPVASILGLVDLVDASRVPPEDAEIVHHLKAATERLDTIIRDLTKIIDIRHDIFRIRQKIVLANEIDAITKVLRKEIEKHGVTIERDIENCQVLYSVKPMVHSILYNLISNAIKYHSSERKPVIEIRAEENASFYVLEIKDNGLGIDLKRHKDNLFKLYKRFHFHTEGQGLGLYLVKLQAEALGGMVQVDSEMNRFTKFTVLLHKPENIQRQILFKETYAEIFFDARLNSTGVIWNGPVTSEQYRFVFQKCLDFVKVYNTPNYIADISHQGPLASEDQRWMFKEIMPDAARNGLRKIAAVRPDAAEGVVLDYLRGINQTLSSLGVHQEFFLTMKDACDWIESENEKISLK
jgi:signal transduction histidine kinase